jgi:hypothetical protein
LLAAGLLGRCSGASRPGEPLRRWVSYDAGRRAVSIMLIPDYNGVYGGYNFNGYSKGQVLVSVPMNWRITVHCVNTHSEGRHSCAVVKGPGDERPAFPGAASSNPLVGLRPGEFDTFSFTAHSLGVYRLACLLAQHERAGEWDVLAVTRDRLPSVRLLRSLP